MKKQPDAIRWAQQKGIMMGTSATQFSPNAPMTREQLAVALYRYAKYLGRNTGRAVNLSGFEDGNAVSSFARDAMAWAGGRRVADRRGWQSPCSDGSGHAGTGRSNSLQVSAGRIIPERET